MTIALTLIAVGSGASPGTTPLDSMRATDSASVSYRADARVGGAHATCPSARRGLRFYRQRYNEHRQARNARTEWPVGRKPLSCADARQLASVWRGRALTARRVTERWQRDVGRVVARLESGIREAERMHGVYSPMRGTADELERVARRHGVSPYFVLAVAMTESSMGAAACSSNRRNVWGLSSCGPGWYVPTFGSWTEAYDFFARFVNRQFPGHSTPYSFRGYAACSECWARRVTYYMGALFGVPARTVYP